MNEKNGILAIASLLIWLLSIVIAIGYWFVYLPDMDSDPLIWASIIIWWVALLWGIHGLLIQLLSLFSDLNEPQEYFRDDVPSVAILYVTYNDFVENCCLSCTQQDYANYRVIICDDTTDDAYKQKIANFIQPFNDESCKLLNRQNHTGYKAGNLNYAIENEVKEDWVLVVDADQELPITFLSELVSRIPNETQDIGFIQAAALKRSTDNNTNFQDVMADNVELFYFRDLPARVKYGFLPMLGHGALIPVDVLREHRFPELVSEDFAWSMRIAADGKYGIYVPQIVSIEDFPQSFGAYITRFKKYAGGTAELMRKELPRFLISSISASEKWDFTMQIMWYLLIPFVTLNSFIGAYAVSVLSRGDSQFIHPLLPYLFTWLVITMSIIVFSINQNVFRTLSFVGRTTSLLAIAMPLATLHFLIHLFKNPEFIPTPKNGDTTKQPLIEIIFLLVLGIVAIVMALFWYSLYTPILLGHGIAYLLYPIYLALDSNRFSFLRFLLYVPSIMIFSGLVFLWLDLFGFDLLS